MLGFIIRSYGKLIRLLQMMIKYRRRRAQSYTSHDSVDSRISEKLPGTEGFVQDNTPGVTPEHTAAMVQDIKDYCAKWGRPCV